MRYAVFFLLFTLTIATPFYVESGEYNGHELLQDALTPTTSIEFNVDSSEVYDAVQLGLIKPLSKLYAVVETQLKGRVIRVELDEEDGEWVYELKLVHDNNVIKVDYNATSLDMIKIKGHNLHDVIKNRDY